MAAAAIAVAASCSRSEMAVGRHRGSGDECRRAKKSLQLSGAEELPGMVPDA
jgi:hypothetical protein